ncbi:SAV_2336 N-terminal domain-related protein [Streptomyces sp. NPDC050803]|uniref:SAV_2336 N-terminal domain-related protein n=1 Tax=unclassified Streptomyces TaxID=2593676 RepID=UPI00341E8B95
MGSDPGSVARLAAVLAAAAGEEAGPTPREMAELLWFAGQLGVPEERRPRPGTTGKPPAPLPPSPPPPPDAPKPPPPPSPPPTRTPDGRIPLHLPRPSAPRPGTPLLAPAPPMLHHPLALQRALRPLKRNVASPHARVLDEHATADRIARLDTDPSLWLPVLRPAPERWLRLNLVHDTGPTMPVWRPLVRELHTTLAQSGIFRTVTLHPAGPDGRARQVPDLADGRTVTLVVSDCMGPQWRPGEAGDRWYRTLRHWAARMPLAVVQPLPEHLWHTTALPAEPGVLTAPAAAAPAAALSFAPYAPFPPPAAAVPLPVLEPGPSWLAHWAGLLSAPDGGRAPGAVAWLPPAPVPPPVEPDVPDVASLPPQDLVLRFRATASPEAFRLAGHLALAVPALPVMRLVQRALERSPRPQHLAEIVLSGMLTAVPGPAGSYEFRPGVRELLLRSLPRTARTRTREFLARVGGLIDERAGIAAGEFRAEAGGEGEAFATVRAETVRRLGGGEERPRVIGRHYRLVERRGAGRRMWEAVDTRTDGRVLVQLYPRQPFPAERFLREAQELMNLDHPNLVRVLDFGVEREQPYLITEFVDGLTVSELVQGSGPGVSFSVFARLARDVVPALDALHARGLVRGQAGSNGLLLRPDGSAMISRFALGEESRGQDLESDFLELDQLFFQLSVIARATAPPPHRTLLARIADGGVRRPARTAAAQLASTTWPGPRYRLLGPPRIEVGNPRLFAPSPEARAMLCMLLLMRGRRIANSTLAQGLWENPPPNPEATERIAELAADLRRHLGPGTLAALADGYALYAADSYIDVVAVEDLLERHTSPHNALAYRADLQGALSLWYGDPLDGVPGPAAKLARARLRALHQRVCVARAELDLDLEDFAQAAADLTTLLADHPDNGEFRRLHMLALRGLGRISEAMDSYEAYEAIHNRQYADPIDPALQLLYRELRDAPQQDRPAIMFRTIDLSGSAEREALGRAVTRLLSRGGLALDEYELNARDNGYLVVTEPGARLLPVLVAVLRGLPEALALPEPLRPLRLLVTFWPTQTDVPPDLRSALDRSADGSVVVIHDSLYEKFVESSAAGSYRFWPLSLDEEVAWYHALSGEDGPSARDLVRGPFTTDDLSRLGPPAPGTAVVHTRPDGPLTLLDPDGSHGDRPPGPITFFDVNLSTQQYHSTVALPSSRGGTFAAAVEISWYVDDPVAFVLGRSTDIPQRLLDHFLDRAARITRRHPAVRAGAAQRELRTAVREWPVPGLSVTYSVSLNQPPLPDRPSSPHRTLADLLRPAESVLIAFEGPFVRLFPPQAARTATLDLLSLAIEHRDPAETLAGRPFPDAGNELHPLGVLRAFADHPLGPLLRDRLDELELGALAGSTPTRHSAALVRALYQAGRRVRVVTDCSEAVVHAHLGSRSLPVSGVYGRAEDLRLLMPNADCLLRALHSPALPAPTGLLIGSSVAELEAAQSLGLGFIGYAPTPEADRRLREAGCETTVSSLEPLVEAARTL